jgi:hypothetical protein
VPIEAVAYFWDHELVAYRRMRDPGYRRQQWEDRRAPHVAPVNALVDRLQELPGMAGVPYVAPVYGGVKGTCSLRRARSWT